MNILLLEPFFSGIRQRWAEGYQRYSHHTVQLLTLPVTEQEWSAQHATETLANAYLAGNYKPELILATDTLDLKLFKSLTAKLSVDIPIALYFHESQPEKDFASAVAADKVFFNSAYHSEFFLQVLAGKYEDADIQQIAAKSAVLPYGVDLKAMDSLKPEKVEKPNRAVVLWNHAWNDDHVPKDFFSALTTIADRGVDFRVVLLGKQPTEPTAYLSAFQKQFADRILHSGYVEDVKEYIYWLSMSDVLPVTAVRDFFGASVIEAMYCDVVPLLPKRLAYPEHIPQQFHRTFFYNDYEHMVNRLHRLIMDVRVIRPQKLGHFISKYDWSQMAPAYDAAFTAMVQ